MNNFMPINFTTDEKVMETNSREIQEKCFKRK